MIASVEAIESTFVRLELEFIESGDAVVRTIDELKTLRDQFGPTPRPPNRYDHP